MNFEPFEQDNYLEPDPEEYMPPAPRVHTLYYFLRILGIGLILALLFNTFSPLGILPINLTEQIAQMANPDPEEDFLIDEESIPRIGIVVGHWMDGQGEVCNDGSGITEVEVNQEIASWVQRYLQADGYQVDLFPEFSDNLTGYRASALISIHSDSCEFQGVEASGFKVAPTLADSQRPQRDDALVSCLQRHYLTVTGLPYLPGGLNEHMTSYHSFTEIYSRTPSAVISTGFLNLDRQILVDQPQLVAEGIADGIRCYINGEIIPVLPDNTGAEE